MIQAKDLRIGNIIRVSGDSREITVDFISIEGVFPEKYIINDWPIEELEPIPLTEEWLLKFWFITSSQNILYLNLPIDGWSWCLEFVKGKIELTVNDEYQTNCNIQYVHQLQNLYFALTGEELTIKELIK